MATNKSKTAARIIVDNDPALGYERNGIIKKIINIFYTPFLNFLPSSLRHVLKKTNDSAQRVVDTATTHEAIEVLYNNGERFRSKSLLQRFFHSVWFNTNNPKALRNRLRLVEREIMHAVEERVRAKKKIQVLSIASGSARAVLEAIQSADIGRGAVSMTFLDKNPRANDYSKRLHTRYRYPDSFTFRWVTDTASNFPAYFSGGNGPDVVEMVGLMDYFPDQKVAELFKIIYASLSEGGVFIVGNISDNSERRFVTNVVGWKMVYRTPEQFLSFAERAGFKNENLRVYYEPMKIHFVMVARK